MELLVITIFVIMIFVAFFLGFEFGKFKGAKDGIDYCFEQREKELIDSNMVAEDRRRRLWSRSR